MTKEEAIQLAVDNGYKATSMSSGAIKLNGEENFKPIPIHLVLTERDLLDPLFWQAFGKGMGWRDNFTAADPEWKTLTVGQMENLRPIKKFHNFVDHLWEGEDIASWFQNLTPKS